MIRFVFCLLICAITAIASEVKTSVSYVSATTVYLSAGSSSGIAAGDSVVVARDQQIVARMLVSFVAGTSSSCESVEAAAVHKGDTAVVLTRTPEPAETASAEEDAPVIAQTTGGERVPGSTRQARVNRLSGRIGLDYAVQNDREPVNYDYSEPALSVRATLEKIGGSDLSARTNLKLRRTSYGDSKASASSNRIYEALLVYAPKAAIEAGLGRTILRETRGMGYLDGAYFKYGLTKAVKLGTAAGVEPELQNTEYRTDVTKAALFIAFDRRWGPAHALQGTASLAGRYFEGEVSREFFYQQLAYTFTHRLRIFESTEINLNRDWLKDAEGSTLTVASFLFDARYSVSRAFAVSLGYDNRTNYYTAETRSTPDSLFNSALQTGYKVSTESRFANVYSADAGLGIRESSGGTGQSTSGWLRVGTSDAAGSLIAVYARVRWYDSEYSTGYQPALTLSREAARWLHVGMEGGLNRYELADPEQTVANQWAALSLDFEIARRSYAALECEQGFGEGRDATWLRLSLGTRF